MAVSNETLRVYDEGIRAWLQGLHIDYGSNFFGRDLRDFPIFTISTTPERAFADMRTQLIKSGMVAQDATFDQIKDDEHYKQTPLPFARFQMTDIQPDTLRNNVPHTMRTYHSVGLTWSKRRFPTPYNFSYTVEFVSRKMYTMNYISEWIMGQFSQPGASVNARFIDVVHPFPWDMKVAEVTLESFSDNSELEAEEARDRLIRKTLTVTVHGWDFDLVGEDVPAVMSTGMDVRLPGPHDKFGVYDGLLLSQITDRPFVVYHREPVPPRHTTPFTTGSYIGPSDGDPNGLVDLDVSEYVETSGIPLRASDLFQGRLKFSWCAPLQIDPDAADEMTVSVIWRDIHGANDPIIAQTTTVARVADEDYALFDYTTAPRDAAREVAIRVSHGYGHKIRVSLDGHAIARTGIAPVSMPTSFPTPAEITLPAPRIGKDYSLNMPVFPAIGDAVQVTVYTDISKTQVVYQRTFTEAGEVSYRGSSPVSGLFVVGVTATDPASGVGGPSIIPAVVVPFDSLA